MPALHVVCPDHQRARVRRLVAEVDGSVFPLKMYEIEKGFVVSGSRSALRHALFQLSELWIFHRDGDNLSITYVDKV
jgi:hypothetical protein